MGDWPRGTPQYVSALPSSPVDGQEIYYVADATNGVIWHLRYNAGSSSAYKWEFLGGSDLFAEVTTLETTTSTSFVALTTAGPSITVPLAGDYDVEVSFRGEATVDNAAPTMSYDIGATAASFNEAALFSSPNVNRSQNARRTRRKTGLAAATALVSKYEDAGAAGTVKFQDRMMRARPVRVG